MKKLTVLAMFALATVFAGCCSMYKNHVTGPGADELTIESARTTIIDGRMTAQVTLTNDDDEPMTMRYRIVWKNAAGMTVSDGNPASSWQSITFAPYECKDIVKPAPMDGCADFRLYLEEPQD